MHQEKIYFWAASCNTLSDHWAKTRTNTIYLNDTLLICRNDGSYILQEVSAFYLTFPAWYTPGTHDV